MTTSVHIAGKLDFASAKRREQGLNDFDGKAYIEFVTKDDWQLVGKKALTINCQTEAPADCIENFHEAFVAAAAAARSGSVELRWDSDEDGIERAYAGGHLVRLLPREDEGALTSLRIENVARDYLSAAGYVAQSRKSDHRFSAWASTETRLAVATAVPRRDTFLPGSDVGWVRAQYYSPENNGVAVFDVETGAELWRAFVAKWCVNDLAWSQDGARLAVASGDGNITVLDAESGAVLDQIKKAFKKGVSAVAWSHDGSRVAALGRDGLGKKHTIRMRLWELGEKKGSAELIKDLDAGRSKKLVFAEDDTRVTVWTPDFFGGPGMGKTFAVVKGVRKKTHTPLPEDDWGVDDKGTALARTA